MHRGGVPNPRVQVLKRERRVVVNKVAAELAKRLRQRHSQGLVVIGE